MATSPYAIGVVPARRGSLGIPGKNVRSLAGRPLVAHTLLAARSARRLDALVCTTDCPAVREIAQSLEIPVVSRPPDLANHSASLRDVVIDLHARLGSADSPIARPGDRPLWYALLYPTSPLRTARHIDDCLVHALKVSPFDSVVSVCQISTAPPSGFLLDDSGGVHFVDPAERAYYRRQEKTSKYRLNGAIWVLDARRFAHLNRNMIGEQTYAFVMDERSSIDIDTPIDLKLAELLLAEAACREGDVADPPWRIPAEPRLPDRHVLHQESSRAP
jgi:N-acylneuraminate cytidylyltransferase/CMP-N,N'-diacetyllegionaminic acid synthase